MYVAESKRLTHQGAKDHATAIDMANVGGVGVSGGDGQTDLRVAKAAVESIGVSWE